MVYPIAVIAVEVVLGAIGIATTAAGVIEGHKAAKASKDEQKKAAVRMLDIKVENDLAQVPGTIPT